VTEAVKDCDPPAATIAAVGEIETAGGPGTPLEVGFAEVVLAEVALASTLPLLPAGAGSADDPRTPRLVTPPHEARHSTHRNKANLRVFVSASCPRRHISWVIARRPALLSGLRGGESVPGEGLASLLIGGPEKGQDCHVPAFAQGPPAGAGDWNGRAGTF
jgi:hypothetical protein